MINNNIDFTNIWKQQKDVQPNKDELLNKLKKYKKSNIKRLFISNVLLIATSGFIIFIWFYYQPQFITTKLGIVLTILAMSIYLFAYNKQYSFFNSLDATQSNIDYLKSLTALKNKQKFIQTTMLSIYFIMLSTGICLYMYEYTSRMTMFWAIFTYGITLTWIAINWFYLRPKTIKKQQTKLNELIEKFETVNKQLHDK